jgi:hypothetical protein
MISASTSIICNASSVSSTLDRTTSSNMSFQLRLIDLQRSECHRCIVLHRWPLPTAPQSARKILRYPLQSWDRELDGNAQGVGA